MEVLVKLIDKEGIVVHQLEKRDLNNVDECLEYINDNIEDLINIRENTENLALIQGKVIQRINGEVFELANITLVEVEVNAPGRKTLWVSPEMGWHNTLMTAMNITKEEYLKQKMGLTSAGGNGVNTTPNGINNNSNIIV